MRSADTRLDDGMSDPMSGLSGRAHTQSLLINNNNLSFLIITFLTLATTTHPINIIDT